MARLEDIIRRAVSEAERKIGAKAKIEAEATERKLSAQVATATQTLARKLDQLFTRELAALEKKAADPSSGVSPEEVAKLRSRLETLEGATSGVMTVSPYLTLLPPQARIAAALTAALLGGAEGATRKERREQSARVAAREDDRGLDTDRIIESARDATDRLAAARRRARGRRG